MSMRVNKTLIKETVTRDVLLWFMLQVYILIMMMTFLRCFVITDKLLNMS